MKDCHMHEDWENAPRLPAAVRKQQESQSVAEILADNPAFTPLRVLHKRTLAASFWGQRWNRNLDTYQEYDLRLDRGRYHLRAGTVVDLQMEGRQVTGQVWEGRLYRVHATFASMDTQKWERFRQEIATELSSVVALLQGQVSEDLAARIVHPEGGLFPTVRELTYSCTCGGEVGICSHIAAVLYGIGVRFDADPTLFFSLRGVTLEDCLQTAGEQFLQEVGPTEPLDLQLFDLDFM